MCDFSGLNLASSQSSTQLFTHPPFPWDEKKVERRREDVDQDKGSLIGKSKVLCIREAK